MTNFDSDALADAVEELDLQYFVGEGSGHAQLLLSVVAFAAAERAQDLDALAEILAPEFVAVDHQRIGFPTVNRDEFIAAVLSSHEVARSSVSSSPRFTSMATRSSWVENPFGPINLVGSTPGPSSA